MERNEIIKALECCTRGRKNKDDIPCLDCPYDECNIAGGTSERQITGTCQSWLKKDALSLIKELTEDNEAQAETITNLIETIKSIQADTVRKMQERIKAQKFTHKNFGELVYVEDIDQIANELMEGV